MTAVRVRSAGFSPFFVSAREIRAEARTTNQGREPLRSAGTVMIEIDPSLAPGDLLPAISRLFALSGEKIRRLDRRWDASRGTPVFTVKGEYTSRGWTEWTQGFQFGSALLQFEATGDESFLEMGRRATVAHMAPHVSHVGVHDHGFNNVSTYGNLLRMMTRGDDPGERLGAELLRAGAEGLRRRAGEPLDAAQPGDGVHLFIQRPALALRRHDPLVAIAGRRPSARPPADGRERQADQPAGAALPARARPPARSTSTSARGATRTTSAAGWRTSRSSTSTTATTAARARQQGYSPFSTWTRGLAWILCGYAEELEFFESLAGRSVRADSAARPRRCTPSARSPRRSPTSTSSRRRRTASRTGTPARPASRGWAITSTAPPSRSTSTSRWTARPPRSRRRGCCGSGDSCGSGARRRRAGGTGRPG